MSYDVSCFELAESFIDDFMPAVENKELLCGELAQEIQDAIEAFLDRYKPHPERGSHA